MPLLPLQICRWRSSLPSVASHKFPGFLILGVSVHQTYEFSLLQSLFPLKGSGSGCFSISAKNLLISYSSSLKARESSHFSLQLLHLLVPCLGHTSPGAALTPDTVFCSGFGQVHTLSLLISVSTEITHALRTDNPVTTRDHVLRHIIFTLIDTEIRNLWTRNPVKASK